MNTDQSIIRTYLSLGAQNGFDNVSLSQIASELGIKKPSLFSHFENFDSLKQSAEDFCLEVLSNTDFTIDFKAPSKDSLFESFIESYSKAFTTYPLNCWISLLDQKKAYSEKYRKLSNQLTLMISSRLTVALDFCVQHGWSDISNTDRLAGLLALELRNADEFSDIDWSEF